VVLAGKPYCVVCEGTGICWNLGFFRPLPIPCTECKKHIWDALKIFHTDPVEAMIMHEIAERILDEIGEGLTEIDRELKNDGADDCPPDPGNDEQGEKDDDS